MGGTQVEQDTGKRRADKTMNSVWATNLPVGYPGKDVPRAILSTQWGILIGVD